MNVLNRLTLKNLRLNKSRTIVTIIGIILSCALITVVGGSASSLQKSIINAEILVSGDYDIVVYEPKASDIKAFENHRDIGAVYVKDYLGCAYLPEAKREKEPYINIVAFNENALNNEYVISLQEGRLPENNSEIVLTQSLIKATNKKFAVGDEITLDVGRRYDVSGNQIPDTCEYGVKYVEEVDEFSFEEDEIYETLKPERTVTYKIVGILDECRCTDVEGIDYSAGKNAITLYTGEKLSEYACINLDILPDREKDYLKIAAELSGLTENETKIYLHQTDSDEEQFEKITEKSKINFGINEYLLELKGYGNSDATMLTIYSIVAVVLAIIIISSVFVIRNSFAISITEKTKLYGMMSSVGATSKQIKRNVLFEGFVLGAIGIPIGLLLGVGVTALLLLIVNTLLADALDGIKLVYSIPPAMIILAVLLSAVTILFSTLSSAVRASKITPVSAIRATEDIKIKKENKIKSPKWVKKIFGTGGDIAYKNLKRSRKKYRTSVISITVSVMLFIAISSFVEMGNKYTSMYYTEMDYNIEVGGYCNCENDIAKAKTDYEKIRNFDNVESSAISMINWNGIQTDKKLITNERLTVSSDLGTSYEDEGKYYMYDINFVGLEDSEYRKAVKALGFDYDSIKDKGILCNEFSHKENGKVYYNKIFKEDSGFELEGILYDDSDSFKPKKIEIGGSVKALEIPDHLKNFGFNEGVILVNEDVFLKSFNNYNYNLCIYSDNADKLQENIENAGYDNYGIYNYEMEARTQNALILVMSIFIYGFIIVITLIGVTNIFNTITTNMRLRSKEFAMLKSIGMTKKEFDRMVRLESLFYGAKSLLFGIPLGILGSVGIYLAFSSKVEYSYSLPLAAIIISVIFVFLIVWMIMRFSVSNVRKQNIIETIREDNV